MAWVSCLSFIKPRKLLDRIRFCGSSLIKLNLIEDQNAEIENVKEFSKATPTFCCSRMVQSFFFLVWKLRHMIIYQKLRVVPESASKIRYVGIQNAMQLSNWLIDLCMLGKLRHFSWYKLFAIEALVYLRLILLGDLKLVEKPSPVILGGHDFTNIKVSLN